MTDDNLTLVDHVAVRLWHFILFNIRKIKSSVTQHATQLLVQAMVIARLDDESAHLTGLPACAVKLLQMVQHPVTRWVFNQPRHINLVFTQLHWLPLAACITFKSLMPAYKVLSSTYCSHKGSCYHLTAPFVKCCLAVSSPRTRQSRLLLCVVHTGGMTSLPWPEQGHPSIFKKFLKTLPPVPTPAHASSFSFCTSPHLCTLTISQSPVPNL